MRAYDAAVDEDQDRWSPEEAWTRQYGLALRVRPPVTDYLDGVGRAERRKARRFSPTFTFGGANLDLPILGQIVSRTGIIFIRRATTDIPAYQLHAEVLHIRQLVKNRRNLPA